MEKHYYYLHVNGDLIHKRLYPDPSDFVVKIWELDLEDRLTAWPLVLEAFVLGARTERIKELCDKWNLSIKDLIEFMVRTKNPSSELQLGLRKYLEIIHNKNYNNWMDWLEHTPVGSNPDFSKMP